MFRRLGLLFIAFVLLVLISLAGCGHNTTTGVTVLPTVTTASSPPASIGTSVSPPVTTASSPPASTGSVKVGTDTPSYRTGDAITVTLSNQSIQTILFPDHLTYCTIVLLQRQVNESWESINLCRMMIVTRMHSLVAGHSLTVKLVAPSNQWIPGLYRAKLSYSASQHSHHLITIYSAAFKIQ
jgi:predicted small secreted protein